MIKHALWDCSSVGRALALQARGLEFEPPQFHCSPYFMVELSNEGKHIPNGTAVAGKLIFISVKILATENRNAQVAYIRPI